MHNHHQLLLWVNNNRLSILNILGRDKNLKIIKTSKQDDKHPCLFHNGILPKAMHNLMFELEEYYVKGSVNTSTPDNELTLILMLSKLTYHRGYNLLACFFFVLCQTLIKMISHNVYALPIIPWWRGECQF